MNRSDNENSLPQTQKPLNEPLRVERGWFPVNTGERGVYSSKTDMTTVYEANRFSSAPFEGQRFLEILCPA
jgi:hypothetical protein